MAFLKLDVQIKISLYAENIHLKNQSKTFRTFQRTCSLKSLQKDLFLQQYPCI